MTLTLEANQAYFTKTDGCTIFSKSGNNGYHFASFAALDGCESPLDHQVTVKVDGEVPGLTFSLDDPTTEVIDWPTNASILITSPSGRESTLTENAVIEKPEAGEWTMRVRCPEGAPFRAVGIALARSDAQSSTADLFGDKATTDALNFMTDAEKEAVDSCSANGWACNVCYYTALGFAATFAIVAGSTVLANSWIVGMLVACCGLTAEVWVAFIAAWTGAIVFGTIALAVCTKADLCGM